MNTIIAALDKKVLVEFDAALWIGLKLDHPTPHAIGIELFVPSGVKRVGEINAFAVAADFNHLRTAG